MQPFLKSLVLKDEYIECPVAIITQSELVSTEFNSVLNLALNDSFY